MRTWTESSFSVSWFLSALASSLLAAERPEREIFPGIATRRVVEGVPLALAGKRIVFTNWHYIQPGDMDWRNDDGKSVYVNGNEGPFAAHHVGIRAPRGIRIAAAKPATIMGPFERPHRMILQDGDMYKGWTDSHYFESRDGMKWLQKAPLQLDDADDFSLYQVFIDPSASADERYKSIGTGSMSRSEFEEFRKRRPDAWEPRATGFAGGICLIHWSSSTPTLGTQAITTRRSMST
jgi:hypothetical protein